MDYQNPTNQDGKQPCASTPPAEGIKPTDPEKASPPTAEQFAEVEKQMSGFEKSTLRWARTAVIMSGLAALFVCAQWYEMRQGGVDTHNLASAAKVAADAAKSAADTAIASSRPWIKIESVNLRPGIKDIKTLMFHWPGSGLQAFPDLAGKELPPQLQVNISMTNVGHLPAQDVQIVPELFFHKFSSTAWHDEVVKEEQGFCRSVANRAPSSVTKIEYPAAPTEDNMGVGGVVRDADITLVNGIRYAGAALLLCVNYRGVDKVPYQTQAWLGVYEDGRILIPIGKDVDADQLRLIREPNGDHAN